MFSYPNLGDGSEDTILTVRSTPCIPRYEQQQKPQTWDSPSATGLQAWRQRPLFCPTVASREGASPKGESLAICPKENMALNKAPA